MKLDPRTWFTRKAATAQPQLAAELYSGPLGPSPVNWSLQSVAAAELIKRYGRWVYRASMLNAVAAAGVPPRLFSVGNREVVEKAYWLRPKPLDVRTKAFLRGRMECKPGSKALAKISGNIDDMTELTKHEVLDVLGNVNDWQEGWAFRRDAYRDKQIVGGHYWHLVGPKGGAPTELWRLKPTMMKVVPSTTQFVDHYEYGYGATKRILSTDEVFWVWDQHPDNQWEMYGPLEAWLKTIDADFAMVQFQDWLFKRGGTPDTVIAAKGFTEKSRKQFRADFRRMFGDMRNPYRESVALLDAEEMNLVQLGNKPRELQFAEGRKLMRDEIGQAFGVPNDILSTENANRATSTESFAWWMRNTIDPMIRAMEDALNQRLLPRWSDRLVLIHDNPIPEDKTILIAETESMLRVGYSVDEVRLRRGDEPLKTKESQEPLIGAGSKMLSKLGEVVDPLTGLPIGSDNAKPNGNDRGNGSARKPKGEDDDTDKEKALAPGGASGLGAAEHEVADEQRIGQAGHAGVVGRARMGQHGSEDRHNECCHSTTTKALIAAWSKKEKLDVTSEQDIPADRLTAFRNAIAAILKRQGEEAAGKLSAVAILTSATAMSIVEAVIADPKWAALFAQSVRPFIVDMVEEGAGAAMGKLATDAVFDVSNPAVQEFVDTYTARLANQVGNYTQVQLRSLIGDGLDKGETVAELGTRVRSWAAENDPARADAWRAERIARTESARAFTAGEEQAWKQSGVVLGKQWLLAPEACEFCEAAAAEFNDKTVALGQAFYSQGSVLKGKDGGTMVLDYGDVNGPPLHPQCVLPDTSVLARRVITTYSAFYDGDAVEIETSNGRRLAVTANHKLLTTNGFVFAHTLSDLNHLVDCTAFESVGDPDDDDGPALITDVINAFAVAPRVFSGRVPVSAEYFHCDGMFMEGNIDVVATQGQLRRGRETPAVKGFDHLPLCAGWRYSELSRLRNLDAMFVSMGLAAHGIVGGTDKAKALSLAGVGHAQVHGFNPVALLEASKLKTVRKRLAAASKALSHCLDRFTRLVAPDKVVRVRKFKYSGHVYDLQTASGLYAANGILSSNCRCDLIPVMEGER